MSDRDLHPEVITHLGDPVVYPAWLFKGMFGPSIVRLWTGSGALAVGSEVYLGNGWLQNFDPAAESEQLSAEGFSITLSGVPTEIVSLVLASSKQNSRGWLYFALLRPDATIYGSPYLKSSGGLDVPEIEDSASESTVRLSYESSLLMLERTNGGRYTDQSQKNRYPNDRFFEYIATIPNLRFTWGKQTAELASA